MTTAKLNVLQLHLAGFDSFPLALPSRPQLVKGAFSRYERYTLRDLSGLKDYAAARGIRLIAELDTPGHAASWCTGMPELCPAPTGRCRQPLNPAINETFETIEAVLRDVVSVLDDEFIHLGEDEFAKDYACWLSSPSITAWLKTQGDWSADDASKYFIERTHTIAKKLRKQTLVWDEVWNLLGTKLDKETVVIHTRFRSAQDRVGKDACVRNATAHGYRVLRSHNSAWYLDQTVNKNWTAQYDFDPCFNLTASQCSFVLGGAACAWGGTVDASNLMQTVWPRSGAIAEKLWSPEIATGSSEDNEPRYVAFRCYLNRRGFAAAPALNTIARSAPPGRGSCYWQ